MNDNIIKKKLRNIRIIRFLWIIVFIFLFFFVMFFINILLSIFILFIYIILDNWFESKENDILYDIQEVKHYNNSLLKYIENGK